MQLRVAEDGNKYNKAQNRAQTDVDFAFQMITKHGDRCLIVRSEHHSRYQEIFFSN